MPGVLSPAAPVFFGPRDFLKVMALGLLLVLVQGSLAAWLGLAGFGPEWALVLAVYVALRSDLWVAVLASFFLGLFRDVLGGSLWGLHSLTLVLLIWLFHPYRARLNFFSPLALAPLVLVLSLVGYLFIMTPLMAILGWPGHTFNPLPGFFVSSGVTAVTAPPLVLLLERLTRNKDPRDD